MTGHAALLEPPLNTRGEWRHCNFITIVIAYHYVTAPKRHITLLKIQKPKTEASPNRCKTEHTRPETFHERKRGKRRDKRGREEEERREGKQERDEMKREEKDRRER